MAVAVATLVPASSASASFTPHHVSNRNSHLCMTVFGGYGERPVTQETCDYDMGLDWPEQHWDFTYGYYPGATTQIMSDNLNLLPGRERHR
jgi:hypothetical protein